jgi:hypothetical protein
MVSKRCSDCVESSGGAAVSVPKAAGMQLLVRFGTAPARYSLGTRGLLTTIRRGERALSIDEFGDLSNDHIVTSAFLIIDLRSNTATPSCTANPD